MMLVGDVTGRVTILIDDMADTSNTITRAARLLKKEGATAVYALITHGILSGQAIDRINKSDLDKVVVTNSVPQEDHLKRCSKLKVLELGAVFAEVCYPNTRNRPMRGKILISNHRLYVEFITASLSLHCSHMIEKSMDLEVTLMGIPVEALIRKKNPETKTRLWVDRCIRSPSRLASIFRFAQKLPLNQVLGKGDWRWFVLYPVDQTNRKHFDDEFQHFSIWMYTF